MASVRARIDLPQAELRQLQDGARRSLRPALDNLADEICEEGRKLARERLTVNRDEARRNPYSTRSQPHYVDSFESGAPDFSGGRARALARNTHPMANLIEHGSPEHDIQPRGAKAMRFPRSSMKGGAYALHAAPFINTRFVHHFGSDPYWILRDAGQNVRDRTDLRMLIRLHGAR